MNPPSEISSSMGRQLRKGLLSMTIVLLSAFLVACSGDSESAPSATRTPAAETPTEAPVVRSTATATQPAATVVPPAATAPIAQPGAMTGIPAIDRVVTLVRGRDVSGVVAQIGWQKIACTTAQGLGGPPKCRPGETPGTTAEVVFSSSCDGTYLRPDEVTPVVGRFMDSAGRLAGVYRHNGLIFPSSQYVVVYSADSTAGNQAGASDSGIVGFTFACGVSVKQFLENHSLTDAILLSGG